MPDAPRITRVGDQREALQQVTAAGGVQARGAGGQLTEGCLSGWHRYCGHARIGRQRSPLDKVIFDNPLS
jgi:hypothetical protein